MTQRYEHTYNLKHGAWAVGNRGEGYNVFVALEDCDMNIGYAETLDEAEEIVLEYERS